MKVSGCNFEVSCLGQDEVNISEFERKLATFYHINLIKQKRHKVFHHIVIFDLSKQDERSLVALKSEVLKILNLFKKGKRDYMTIMLYSSDFECYRIMYPIKCETESYVMADIEAFIATELKSLPSHSLSKILDKANEMTKQLETLSDLQQVIILSDRMWNLNEVDHEGELTKCHSLVKQLNDRDVALTIFGIGHYYDRSFFLSLVNDGQDTTFRHLSDVKDFYKYFQRIYQQKIQTIKTDLEILNQHYFIVDEQQMCHGAPYNVRFNKKGTNLIVTFDGPLKLNHQMYPLLHELVENNILEEFGYHLALYHLKHENIKSALASILYTKDVFAYKQILYAYSSREISFAQEFIHSLIHQKTKRYKHGKHDIYPSPIEEEPLCLIELLKEIMTDKDSSLQWDYSYSYQHIGPRQTLIEDQFMFQRREFGYTEVNELAIGSRKLNINLLVKVEGQVENIKTHLKLDAHVYREYNLVLNGNLNMNELCCVLSKPLKVKYRKAKLIKQTIKYGHQDITILNLTKLKIVNQRVLRMLTPTEILLKIYQTECLATRLSVIKQYLNQIKGKASVETDSVKDELSEIKKAYRVNDKGLYTPLGVNMSHSYSSQGYFAAILEWKISRFPKKIETDKAIKQYQINVLETLNEYEQRLMSHYRELVKKRKELLFDVNLIRLSCGLSQDNIFIFDSSTEKAKKETDPVSKENKVVNELMIESLKSMEGIELRQLEYEVKVQI